MTIYHGTDKESAEKIVAERILKGDRNIFGPGICLTIGRALNYSAIKCFKHGRNARSLGRIIMIEGLPSHILNNASKDGSNGFSKNEAFTLNNEFGNPSKGLHFQNVKVLTIKEAQRLQENLIKLK
jgi:hypothetical protein